MSKILTKKSVCHLAINFKFDCLRMKLNLFCKFKSLKFGVKFINRAKAIFPKAPLVRKTPQNLI